LKVGHGINNTRDTSTSVTSNCQSEPIKKDALRQEIFPIVNFPFICNDIPAAPAYGIYISQFIRYSRACSSYHDFLDRGLLLTRKLLNQEFLLILSS